MSTDMNTCVLRVWYTSSRGVVGCADKMGKGAGEREEVKVGEVV